MYTEKMEFYESLKAIFLHIDNAEKAFLNQFKLSVPRFYTLFGSEPADGIHSNRRGRRKFGLRSEAE